MFFVTLLPNYIYSSFRGSYGPSHAVSVHSLLLCSTMLQMLVLMDTCNCPTPSSSLHVFAMFIVNNTKAPAHVHGYATN